MPQSHLKYFHCNAKELIELIKSIYGPRWDEPSSVKKISHLYAGIIHVFSDGELMEKCWIEEKRDNSTQVFLGLVDRIYAGESIDFACMLLNSLQWREIARIIVFGKEHNIPREDWGVVLR